MSEIQEQVVNLIKKSRCFTTKESKANLIERIEKIFGKAKEEFKPAMSSRYDGVITKPKPGTKPSEKGVMIMTEGMSTKGDEQLERFNTKKKARVD